MPQMIRGSLLAIALSRCSFCFCFCFCFCICFGKQAENFQQVAPLASLTVTSIAVGAFHNLAVTSDGECFP